MEQSRALSLQLQDEVRTLTEAVRAEELAKVTALCSGPGSSTGEAAAPPGPPVQLPLLGWAAGFAANAPPSVALAFQHFPAGQEAAFNTGPPAAIVPPGGGGHTEHVHIAGEEDDEDYAMDKWIDDNVLAGRHIEAAAAAAPTIGGPPPPTTSVPLQAAAAGASTGRPPLSAFGRARPVKPKDGPYLGSSAEELATGAAIAAQAEALLGDPAGATGLQNADGQLGGCQTSVKVEVL